MILAIDVEATGLPAEDQLPSNPEGWPRMIQVGAVLASPSGKIVERWESIVRPARWEVENTAVEVHGITTEFAELYGRNQVATCDNIARLVDRANVVVGHSLEFDYWTIRHEAMDCFRMFRWPTLVCTLGLAQKIYGEKISLADLHALLFGQPHAGQHGALADAEASLRCYLAMKSRGL